MNGMFSIASFNLHNYNYDSCKDVFGDDVAFKREKLDQIVKIITDGGYDIIALQEIQTPQTVRSIVGGLNEGRSSGGYDFVHCQSFYEKISDNRFKSPEREKRGELAFIWNTKTTALFKGCAAYQRLNERMWLALDYFVQGASAAFAGLLGMSALVPDEEDGGEKRKKHTAHKTLKWGGAAGLAAIGYAGHRYLDAQLKRMRPPFVAFFNKVNGMEVDQSKQLRLINVHSQFGKTDADSFVTPAEIRDKEAEFVLQEAFQIVKSEQIEDSDLNLVMALGDFNRSAHSLSQIAAKINAMPMRGDQMKIGITKEKMNPDGHLTTVSVSNPNEVKEGQRREYAYSHDYDHFAFDMDVWQQEDAKRVFGLSDERFFVLEGNDRCAISDHLPIAIKTMDF